MLLNRKTRASLETALCVGLLAVLALSALFPMLRGKVPLATQRVLFEAPWEEARPAGLRSSGDDDTAAQAVRFYPWYTYLSHAARTQDSILWNPLGGCGTPFLAQWRTRCFSPFSLPFYLFSPTIALCISVFLKLLIAGWCAFHAARKLGFELPLAFAAGVAFEFSGHVYLWLDWPVSDVVPWLPLLLVYVERLLKGYYRYWPLGAIVVAVMALGGDPETLVTAFVLVFLYAVIRSLFDRQHLRHSGIVLVMLVFSGVLGLALVAFQLLPFFELLRQAVEAVPIRPTHLTLRDLAVGFLPNLFGSPSAVVTEGEMVRSARVAMLLHTGLVQLWLVPLWLAVRRSALIEQRRRVEALLMTAVVMTGIAFLFGRPGVGGPLRYLRPEHFLVGNALVFALMSIAAAGQWLDLTADQCKAALKRLGFWLVVLWAADIALLVASRGAPRAEALPLWAQCVSVCGLFVAFLVILGITLLRPSVRIMGYSLAGLVFVSSVLAFGPGISFLPRDAVFPETPFIRTLAERGERIGGSDALQRWPLSGNLIPQVYCPSATQPGGLMLARYAGFVERIKADPLLLRRAGAAVLLLDKKDIQGAFAPIRPNLVIQHVFSSGALLLKDLETKPRAWVAYDWRVGKTFDPKEISVGLPPIVENGSPPSGGKGGAEAKVALLPSDNGTRIEIDVDSPLPGMLILADAFYPGWRATVDGAEAPIFPVDGLFRGVPVKEGKHRVVFRYNPFSVKLGAWISGATFLFVLIEVRHVLRQRREKKLSTA